MEGKYAILIVDDNVDLTKSLRDVLEAEDYDVTVAHNGQDTLAICRQKNFDLALIDIKLPDTSGTELIEEIARLNSDMEYIIITGHASLGSAIDAVKKKKVVSYETKPLDIEHILALIRQIFARKQTEIALREAEAELKHTIDVAPIIITKANAHTGYFTDCNPALSIILGFSSEEFLARPFIEFIHPDDRQSTIDEVEKQLKGNQIAKFENRYICKDGTYKWLEWMATAADENGVVYAAATDITERKQAEKALWESEQNFRNSIDASPLGIRIVSIEGDLLYINKAILDIYGYSNVEELRNTPRKQRYTPESYDEHQTRKKKRKRGGLAQNNYEISIMRKDGEIRHLLVFRKEVMWSGETQFQALYQDITERKKAEEKITSLAKFPGENPNPVLRVAKNGTILYANKGSTLVLDIGECETGKSAPEFYRQHVNDVLNSGTSKEIEIDVGASPFSFVFLPVADEDYVNIYGRDITERKRAEEALRESEEKYRAIYFEARDGIVLIDSENGYIIDCNPEFEHQTGRKLKQLKKMMIWQMRPPEKVEAAKKTFLEIKEAGVGGSSELEFQKPNGKIVFIEFLAKRIKIQGKDYLQTIARDITERKRAEEDIRKLSHAVEQSASTIVITDVKGDIEYVNPQFTKTTGYTSEEVMSKNPRILKSGTKSSEEYKELWETINSGREWRGCNSFGRGQGDALGR